MTTSEAISRLVLAYPDAILKIVHEEKKEGDRKPFWAGLLAPHHETIGACGETPEEALLLLLSRVSASADAELAAAAALAERLR